MLNRREFLRKCLYAGVPVMAGDYVFLKDFKDYSYIEPVKSRLAARIVSVRDNRAVSGDFSINNERVSSLCRGALLEFTGKKSIPVLYLEKIEDARPHNERIGYKTLYIDSISDDDYNGGFAASCQEGFRKELPKIFVMTRSHEAAEIWMKVRGRHFYGEYFRTVKAGIWEFGTALCLFAPRLITGAIPYNSFAGRVAMDVSFIIKNRKQLSRSFDVRISERVSTYKRGSYSTALMLSERGSRGIVRPFL